MSSEFGNFFNQFFFLRNNFKYKLEKKKFDYEIFFKPQVGKEMLTIKPKTDEEPSFNLLMELLRGEH